MIELLRSTDGKHTMHVSAYTPEELAELVPKAKALYEKIIESYDNKAQMWQMAIDKEPGGLKIARVSRTRVENVNGMTPICPIHGRRMKLHHGLYRDFWSCKAYSKQVGWCRHTVSVAETQGRSSSAT